MASSTKRRASSSKQGSAGKAQVISVGRKDALPRQGNVTAGRRKPAVPPPVDAPKQPLATALARSSQKAHKLQPTDPSATRSKRARSAGRPSGKLNKPGAMQPVGETVAAVEAATADGVSSMAALEAPEGEALAIVETEVEASAIMEETTIVEAPIARAPHHEKRALVAAASRLLSMLFRWTGVRR